MLEKLFIFLVRFYQKAISPHFKARCRFYPTCSEYAVLAVQKYGFFKGFFKTVWRILRCNPLSKGGVDYP